MDETLILGDPPIDVVLRRSARARRISLRVSGLDGKVSITLPRRGSVREARRFLMLKEPWIRKHLAQTASCVEVAPGAEIPIGGTLCRVTEGTGPIRVDEGEMIVVDASKAAAQVRAYLKTRARDRLATASSHYAGLIGRDFTKITLRDTRSRWGSCSSEGNLMYSWRLIMAPPEVLDYVAAHEVAHLVEMNHAPAFWKIVGDLMPDYQLHRTWLRKNGAQLHRYKF